MKLTELVPAAFHASHTIPDEYSIPGKLYYCYMIHTLCKTYGIPKSEAAAHTELDFWEMIAFENLDRAKHEWLLRKMQDVC